MPNLGILPNRPTLFSFSTGSILERPLIGPGGNRVGLIQLPLVVHETKTRLDAQLSAGLGRAADAVGRIRAMVAPSASKPAPKRNPTTSRGRTYDPDLVRGDMIASMPHNSPRTSGLVTHLREYATTHFTTESKGPYEKPAMVSFDAPSSTPPSNQTRGAWYGTPPGVSFK
jgi:hypothetical protein